MLTHADHELIFRRAISYSDVFLRWQWARLWSLMQARYQSRFRRVFAADLLMSLHSASRRPPEQNGQHTHFKYFEG